MLEYHLPGMDHRKLTNKEYAQKIAHLRTILEDERKKSQSFKL